MKKFPIDTNDLLFYIGLCALGVGLFLLYGLGLALIVVGAVLTGISFINSLILVWLSKNVT